VPNKPGVVDHVGKSGEVSAVPERITSKTVCFRYPFKIAGAEGEHPAGIYTVETTEEPIGGLSFIAYRRVSTTIVLASRSFGPAARQVVTIEPADLDAALERDVANAELNSTSPPGGAHNP
jgi:hypothetical protein